MSSLPGSDLNPNNFTGRFVSDGRYLDYVPTADVAAGDVIVVGTLVGVAIAPIRAGCQDSLCVDGVIDLKKAVGTGTGIAGGAKLYWDATNVVATASDGGGANQYIGKAVFAGAQDGDATVRVRFHPL